MRRSCPSAGSQVSRPSVEALPRLPAYAAAVLRSCPSVGSQVSLPSVEALPRLPVWAGRGSSGGIMKFGWAAGAGAGGGSAGAADGFFAGPLVHVVTRFLPACPAFFLEFKPC